MRLSIIIPVYNNEKTLERCVTSIISQSFRDYQMILVDDASTDKSPSMCDDFVKADHRIQVVHKKENAGLSEARNTGIRKARGEYITFIDSDDYIQADTLAQLMEILSIHHEYDILEYPVWEHYGNPKKQRRLFLKKNVYINMDEYWFKGKAYMHSYAWNKIYKRELFTSLSFPKGRKFEDLHTLPSLLEQCSHIATTNKGLYYYCYNPQGITAQASARDHQDLLDAHLPTVRNLAKKFPSVDKRYLAEYYAHVLNIQLDVYEKSAQIPLTLPILPYYTTFKLKLLHLLGLRRLCIINKYYHRICHKHHS